jgi:hypothetical protein
MGARNLALFFPDDRLTKSVRSDLIDLINSTPFLWERHCREIARNKQITIDLMSADINYTRDRTDPAFDSNQESNSWGFVHALVGLVRRRSDDGYGNHLPLAWEVRTVSPDAYRHDNDATRLYGLVRSLAAEPEDAESLEDTIYREFERDHPQSANKIPRGKGTLADVFIQDLAQQRAQLSEPPDALTRLLPRWRMLFRRAVAARKVLIDPRRAQQTLKQLKRQTNVRVDVDPVPTIPISKRGKSWYGISLLSVMADLVDGDHLDLTRTTSALAVVEDPHSKPRPGNVLEWYQTIIEAAGGKLAIHELAEGLKNFANRFHDQIQLAPQKQGPGLDDLVNNLARSEADRALLLIVLIAHTTLRGEDFTTLRQLSKKYRYTHSDNLFNRPLQRSESIFGPFSKTIIFAKNLDHALKGQNHSLGDTWEWIKQGLQAWYDEKLQRKLLGDTDAIALDVAKKRAPGLFS